MRSAPMMGACAWLWMLSAALAAGGVDEAPRPVFGFAPLINSRVGNGIAGLRAADVDGDGLTDLLVIDNQRARVEILRQRRPGEEPEPFDPETINDLPDESYFARESYPIEQKVTSVAVADLDSDGTPDLCFVGDSGRLTVVYRDGDGHYARARRFDVDSPSVLAGALRVGDLNQDDRADLVLLCERVTATFLQDTRGVLLPGPKFPNATPDPGGFELVDVDGDGWLDLLAVELDSDWPFRCRLGRAGPSFGPETRSKFVPVRSFAVADLDGDGRVELGAVRRRSGRFTRFSFGPPAASPPGALVLGEPRVLPFETYPDSSRRTLLLADVTSDGRLDLLAAEPAAARLVLAAAGAGPGFGAATVFPSLVGSTRPCVADLDGDGNLEVVVMAAAEAAVGIAQVGPDGRIGFPRAVPVPGDDLLALDVADQDGDGRPEIWVVTASGRSRSRKRSLVRLSQGEDAFTHAFQAEADPEDLLLVDLDRDGRRDALLFVPTRLPVVLMASGDGFEQLPAKDIPGLGLLKGVGRDALALGDLDGDGLGELLAPGPNFARGFSVQGRTTEVVAQFNLPEPAAQVTAVGLGQLEPGGLPEVLLVDRSEDRLVVMRQTDDGPEVAATVDLGGLAPVGLRVADLDADGLPDVLLIGRDQVAVLRNGGAEPRFVAGQEFELPVKKAHLDRLAFGDLNADDAIDLVLTETNKHLVGIAVLRPDGIQHALRFPVFEQRTFGRGRDGREPRELLLADVTGDRRQDICIVVHDRILVYPQE